MVLQQAKAVGWGMALIVALGGISHLIKTWSWRFTFLCDLRRLSFGRAFVASAVNITRRASVPGQDWTRVAQIGLDGAFNILKEFVR